MKKKPEVYTVEDLLPPIGTPPRKASEQRLAEEQAKRREGGVVIDVAMVARLRAALDAEDYGDLISAAREAAAEIKRLRAALREIENKLISRSADSPAPLTAVLVIIDAALSGKGEKT